MNNKKLFKGALVLFASILMAVSCSSNSKPSDEEKDSNTSKPTAITKDEIQTFLRSLGDMPEESEAAKFNFSQSTLTEDGVFESAAADAQPTITKALAGLKTALKALPKTGKVVLNLTEDEIGQLNWERDATPENTGKITGKVKIKIKSSDNTKYSLDKKYQTITIGLKGNDSNNWK